MKTCPSCGGILGQDCFNPSECAAIGHMQQQQASSDVFSLTQRVNDLENRLAALEAKETAAKKGGEL